MCEDWGEIGDDMGPEDWEMACDIPDYAYEEYDNPRFDPGDYLEWEDEEVEDYSDHASCESRSHGREGNRAASIIQWLSRSDMTVPFLNGDGFSITGGYLVRLLDGSIHDLIEWLHQEGIRDGVHSARYGVREDRDGGVARISFYPVIDAPFHNRDEIRKEETDDGEDLIDIPF